MTFLEEYLHRMRMSHIYQPVMIQTLLINDGVATTTEIARALLNYDQSQVEYYEERVRQMVGKVLTKNKVVIRERNIYQLATGEKLTEAEKEHLIALCDEKIQQYIDKRGEAIFQHRHRNRKPVPGSVRYQVLKRAKGRCELCGISKELKALEVDHIVPKNHGGEDDISNYQALCYTCNANKRDTDSEDFRNLNVYFDHREDDCAFCHGKPTIIAKNELAISFFDRYPVTQFHSLIIPKRHCDTYFDLSQPEINAIHQLTHETRNEILRKDSTVTGFNHGFNSGSTAGQTVFHCHLHLIPRRTGDMSDPRGGIRHAVAGKGYY
jgi:diadenosine tetraphosphate (Ap4A) HIT family hydrolase/5-methylcytosine-specific restriction endonuclease McrA